MSDPPIACTLSRDDLGERLRVVDALAADGLLQRTAIPTGVRVRLRDTPDVERRTRELIAAESSCCAFLDFTLAREDGDLVLDITGPDDARSVIDLLFAPGGPQSRRGDSNSRPLHYEGLRRRERGGT